MEQNQNQDFHYHVLMQYFCLHGILPFSKSYPEIECTWPMEKCRGRKSFDMWYYIVTSYTLCKLFVQIESNECFSKTYSRKKEIVLPRDSKELFYLFLKSFWSKSKAHAGAKSKNKHPSWLYCNIVELPEAATGGVV